jgi:hypothetical protein
MKEPLDLEPLRRMNEEPPTRMEFADGLRKSRAELVRSAVRSVSVVLSRLRRRKRAERPLSQQDIDARYEVGADRYSKRIHKRLMRGAANRPVLYVSDSRVLVIERRDKR